MIARSRIAAQKYEHELIGLQQPARHLAGRCAVGEAAPAGGVERGPAGRGRTLRRRCSPSAEDVVHPAAFWTATSTCGICTWYAYLTGTGSSRSCTRQGIGAGIDYPVPVHLSSAYAGLGYADGAFPVAERAAREVLSLPLFPGITPAQQERVVSALAAALRA